jgi:hypothetical protein
MKRIRILDRGAVDDDTDMFETTKCIFKNESQFF